MANRPSFKGVVSADLWYRSGHYLWTLTLAGLVAIGVGARLFLFLSDRGVTHDEGLLYLALQRWSPNSWFTPLGFEQTAGPLYLGILHALAKTGPHPEYIYRLVSLVASLFILPVVYISVKILRPGRSALIATTLLALHSGLIIYTGFFKQYETDAFAAAFIFGLAAFIKVRGKEPGTWWIVLTSGCLCVFLSQPSIVVLACLLVWAFLAPEPMRARRWIVPCGLVWATLAGICYLYSYAPVASSPYMRTFWADSYLSIGTIRGWKNASDALFGASAGGVIPGLVLAFLGIATMVVRRDWTSLILGGGPIVTTTILAILHFYPVAPRLWMFLSPPVAYATAVGAEFVVTKLAQGLPGHHGRVAAVVLVPILAAGFLRAHNRLHVTSAFPAIRALRGSGTRERGREDVAALLRSKSCDPIYVAARSVPTWYFYTSLEPQDNNNRYFLLQSIWRRDSPVFGDAAPSVLHLPDPAPQLVLRVGCGEEFTAWRAVRQNEMVCRHRAEFQ